MWWRWWHYNILTQYDFSVRVYTFFFFTVNSINHIQSHNYKWNDLTRVSSVHRSDEFCFHLNLMAHVIFFSPPLSKIKLYATGYNYRTLRGGGGGGRYVTSQRVMNCLRAWNTQNTTHVWNFNGVESRLTLERRSRNSANRRNQVTCGQSKQQQSSRL